MSDCLLALLRKDAMGMVDGSRRLSVFPRWQLGGSCARVCVCAEIGEALKRSRAEDEECY